MDTYVRRARKLVREGAELEEQILEVEKAIKKEREEKDKKKGSTEGMVSVVVMAKREMEAEFKLTYSKLPMSLHAPYIYGIFNCFLEL